MNSGLWKDQFAIIARLPRLEELNLLDSHLDLEQWNQVSSIKTLRIFKNKGIGRAWRYKDKNETDDEGIRCLAGLAELRELSLSKYLLMEICMRLHL